MNEIEHIGFALRLVLSAVSVDILQLNSISTYHLLFAEDLG